MLLEEIPSQGFAYADDDYRDETPAERQARLATTIVLDPLTQATVNSLVDKMIQFTNALSGHPLRPYQEPFARRIFESMIIGDSAVVTALFSRQSGKSETVANCVASAMIMFPRLAKAFPDLLERFREGVWVGAFAPVDYQADILFGRIVSRLTGERAQAIMADPEINEKVVGKGRTIKLKCGSLVTKNTAHPRASIEGGTFHLILVDECQGAENAVINNSIMPMATATGGTKIFTGTPGYTKNVFHHTISDNKRAALKHDAIRIDHYEADWKEVSKHSEWYRKTALREMLRLGEDSDEFRRQYCNQWLLEKGMFTTAGRLEELGDETMVMLVTDYHRTPVLVGIDLGRKQDRTVVTVVFVDWDHPDQFGYYNHRVLNWLDLENVDWEDQYHRIYEFLKRYNVWKVGVDTNGMGDVFIDRMRRMRPDLTWVDLGSGASEQSVRWKHLKTLLEKRLIGWPSGPDVQKLRVWRRFKQEMADLEIEYKGPYMHGLAPKEADAHDDYPDSLSMACVLSISEEQEAVEQSTNILYTRERRKY